MFLQQNTRYFLHRFTIRLHLFSIPPSTISTIEISACDCSKQVPVGILDPAIPSYCNVPRVETNPIVIDYEVFTAIKPKI